MAVRGEKVLIGFMAAVLGLEGAALAGKGWAAGENGESGNYGSVRTAEDSGNEEGGIKEDSGNEESGAKEDSGNEEGGAKEDPGNEEGGIKEDSAAVEAPRVALTFDDGPNAKYTPLLLDGLLERGISATFFLLGKNVEGNEELVRRMQEEGHLIGNHTYHHVQLDQVSEARAVSEIEETNSEIFEITGVWPMYLRPPYGCWKKNLELSVGMLPVLWDVDTLDWKSRNVDSILKIIRSETGDGSVILMHDAYQTSVDAALAAADYLAGQGYRFVTVDELLVT